MLDNLRLTNFWGHLGHQFQPPSSHLCYHKYSRYSSRSAVVGVYRFLAQTRAPVCSSGFPGWLWRHGEGNLQRDWSRGTAVAPFRTPEYERENGSTPSTPLLSLSLSWRAITHISPHSYLKAYTRANTTRRHCRLTNSTPRGPSRTFQTPKTIPLLPQPAQPRHVTDTFYIHIYYFPDLLGMLAMSVSGNCTHMARLTCIIARLYSATTHHHHGTTLSLGRCCLQSTQQATPP